MLNRGPRSSSWARGLPARFGAAFIAATVLMTAGLALVEHEVEKKIADVKVRKVATKPAPPTGPQNFLIIGSDSRANITNPGEQAALGEDVGHRSDTMMILHIDPKVPNATLMSIPRDLPVDYLNGGHGKINAVFNDGENGAQDVIDLLAAPPFSIPINHYIEIDFDGFKGLVDAIGGIRLWFDAPSFDGAYENGNWQRYTSFAVPSRGCYQLNGEQARAFVRTRHYNEIDADGDRVDPGGGSDLERTVRQQLFMRKLAAKVLRAVNGDYSTAIDVTDKLLQFVTVDPALKQELRSELALIDVYGDLDPLDPRVVASFTLPTKTVRRNGTYDIAADWTPETAWFLAPFRSESNPTPSSAGSTSTTTHSTATSTAAATTTPTTSTTTEPNRQVLPEKYRPDPIFIPERVDGVDREAACR